MIVYTTTHPGTDRGTAPRIDPRPLYIVPTGDTRVQLDGPALVVQREERAEQYFPLQRIARVYSSDRVDWSTDALLACAEQGIGVLFVDDHGEIRARLLGRPGERDELLLRFTEFMLLPQAPDMYQHWLNGMRRRIVYWAGARIDAPRELRDPRGCRQWIERLAIRYTGRRGAERTRQWLRALAYHWMDAHLRDLGFAANTELGQVGEPSLTRDLAELLMWYLEPARIGWLRRRNLAAMHKGEALRAAQHADVVRLFESRNARVTKRGRDLTSSLHRWLIQES